MRSRWFSRRSCASSLRSVVLRPTWSELRADVTIKASPQEVVRAVLWPVKIKFKRD